jgi:hypothetical protein
MDLEHYDRCGRPIWPADLTNETLKAIAAYLVARMGKAVIGDHTRLRVAGTPAVAVVFSYSETGLTCETCNPWYEALGDTTSSWAVPTRNQNEDD